MSDYPEHDKLEAVADKSQAIGEFLDLFLPGKGFVLAEWKDVWDDDVLIPVHLNIRDLLAEFFKIDQDRLETEKRAMLEVIREANR